MFELSVIQKYLIPRRKELSVSLIALMSVAVISLVVWLVLVFLSVTEGMEKGWLCKLTALHAPLRINPTPAYFASYYYKIDDISAASGFHCRSIGEKAVAEISDPYDPAIDQEIPSSWPAKDCNAEGQLIDPVKSLFHLLQEEQLLYQESEVAGAMMRLHMIRKQEPFSSNRGEEKQQYLTQVSYIASLTPEHPGLATLLLPPSPEDMNHVFFLSSYDLALPSDPHAERLIRTDQESLRQRLRTLFHRCSVRKLRPSHPLWQMPQHMLPATFSLRAAGVFDQEQLSHIVIPTNPPLDDTTLGVLSAKDRVWQFCTTAGVTVPVGPEISLFSEATLEASLHTESLDIVAHVADVSFAVKGTVQSVPIAGDLPWKDFVIAQVETEASPVSLSRQNLCYPLLLPKQFQDSGARMGDRGYLSYATPTATAIQEQRVPFVVTGFYDPGILSVGNRCLLGSPELVRLLNAANHSFQIDPTLANGVQVWVADVKHAKATKARLELLLERHGIAKYWSVASYHDFDFAKDLLLQFQSDRYLFTMIGVIVLIVACSNVISLLVLLVNDKKREIGVLQSMGASTASITGIFAGCGIAMGTLSSLIGASAAFLTLRHIDRVVHFLSYLQGHTAFHAAFYGASLPNTLSHRALLFMVIATPVISVLAALVPAWKACRLRPASILRSE